MKGRELEKSGKPWDVIVIGGGITGAGVLREAARQGLSCLLLEQRDFGWGTSSRSGKLVHGGLRYLKQGQAGTTYHSVREREKLLREYGGLVEPLGFLVPAYRGEGMNPRLVKIGLVIYDLIAGRRSLRQLWPAEVGQLVPSLKRERLLRGFWYLDAQTDDARLVYRVIREGERLGGAALNYARVEGLCTDKDGRVRGVTVRDLVSGRICEVYGQAVISATGIWADKVRSLAGAPPKLRKLRGSHLIFERRRFPVDVAVSIPHPADQRPLYIFPWEGVTLVGTTDLDHGGSLDDEPKISSREGKYLLEAVQKYFPALNLSGKDVLSTFAGVRPVVDAGKKDPSRESREHVVWADKGLVTVTGGKLTTFILLANDALARARKWISSMSGPAGKPPPAPPAPPASALLDSAALPAAELFSGLEDPQIRRLAGRYGPDTADLLKGSKACERKVIPGTKILWAELRWAAGNERVVHLDDLLLRRVRLGIVVAGGGAGLLEEIRKVVQGELGWDDPRWEEEAARYVKLWKEAYSPELIN